MKKAAKYASSKMLMDINQVGIFKTIMFYKIDEVEGFSFFKERRGYICDQTIGHLNSVNTTSFRVSFILFYCFH